MITRQTHTAAEVFTVDTPNRYAPPKAEVAMGADTTDTLRADIDELPVSESWKRRFHLIEKAGGVKWPKFNELTAGERARVAMNILGFLFGPLYYICKGMWRKALSLFAVTAICGALLAVVLVLLGLDNIAESLGYGVAAVFTLRSNIDYYKKMVLGDNGWW